MGACNRTDLKCWWHQPTSWKNCDQNLCGNEIWRFDPPANYPEQADGTAYPPNCTTAGLPSNALIIDDVPDSTPIHRPGCSVPKTTSGSFNFTFGSDSSRIDLHQLGAGYSGHFWFAHTRMEDAEGNRLKVTGEWKLGQQINGQAKVFVHIPDHGAQTGLATYEVVKKSGVSRTSISQKGSANRWVELGTWIFDDEAPTVRLTNHTSDGTGDEDIAYDAVAFAPGNYVSMPRVSAPDGVPNSPDPDWNTPTPLPTTLSARSSANSHTCKKQTDNQEVCLTVRPRATARTSSLKAAAGPESICNAVNGGGYDRFMSCQPFEITARWTSTGHAAVSLFQRDAVSRSCRAWTALARRPARWGQQRSFRRMRQDLSWAFARSPGPRSLACARLASLCGSGLSRPL